ncbi:MAG: ABC-F family ATP-binding cassette domain-containing protein [Candidatus Marinimicrobia bacterium]|nr:ABC-F family ATP-binding cassette domain-containing protein [Candidatus Neomarinimicrobiota bacterium]
MLSIDSIWKEFPNKILFKNLSFRLKEGMRVGLVGPNGAGKTTLLKILLGLESPDKGTVDIGKSVSIGYLPQEIIGSSDHNIIEETLAAFPEVADLEHKIHAITEQLADDHDNHKLLTELSNFQEKFEQIGGWDIEKKAKIILSGLGFTEDQLFEPFNSFSGGWRMRCYLAGMLLRQPNYLFLDEPTNHLDLNAIIWMENFLAKWKGGLIMISHDRNFLDKSVNNILELSRGQGILYSGDYSFYINKREELLQQAEKSYNNQQKTIAQTERFIERFRSKNTKSKQVQSRIKQLDKMEKFQAVRTTKNFSIQIPQPDRGPLKVVDINEVTKAYGDNIVYTDLNLIIERGNKIGLVGENGAGKSTLLKLLAKVEQPSSGEINYGPGIKAHYFGQHQVESLDLNATIYDTIFAISGGWTETQIRSYLGSFFFQADMVKNKVKVLSGGEKSRLALARLLVEPANLILLDEPTNHLDIHSRDIIEAAFKKYLGTIICISHDRHFLNAVTNTIIEVDKNGIKTFAGNYDYYLWKEGEYKQTEKKEGNSKKPIKNKSSYKELKRLRNKKRKIEKRMTVINDELTQINTELKNNNLGSDFEKLQTLHDSQNKLEYEYLELMEELEGMEF